MADMYISFTACFRRLGVGAKTMLEIAERERLTVRQVPHSRRIYFLVEEIERLERQAIRTAGIQPEPAAVAG